MQISEAEKQARINRSNQKYEAHYKKQKQRREYLKNGRKVYKDTKMRLVVGKIGTHKIAVGYRKLENGSNNRYSISYALCSPKDTFSTKVARGYLGARTHDFPYHPFHFIMNIPSEIAKDKRRILGLTIHRIKTDILLCNIKVPMYLERAVLNENRVTK